MRPSPRLRYKRVFDGEGKGKREKGKGIAAAALLMFDGSANKRPPVGVGGISTSSVSIKGCCHLPLKGKAFGECGSRSPCLPLEGKVAERSEVG